MQFEIIDKLETKIQQALDTITLLQMEIEEQKEKVLQANQKITTSEEVTQRLQQENQELQHQNTLLKEEQEVWCQRIEKLLGQLDNLS